MVNLLGAACGAAGTDAGVFYIVLDVILALQISSFAIVSTKGSGKIERVLYNNNHVDSLATSSPSHELCPLCL